MTEAPVKLIKQQLNNDLDKIKIENGYINNATILNGYMVHYVRKFSETDEPLNFPCVAIQPSRDRTSKASSNLQSKTERDWVLIGAVSVQNPEQVTDNLDTLLYDVKRSLSFDPYEGGAPAVDYVLGEAVFDLPERGDEYAFFEMPITMKFIESLK